MQEATTVGTPQPAQVVIKPGVSTPQAVYRAFDQQRQEIRQTLDNLEDKRRELASESNSATGASKAGLEARIVEIDKRISDVEKQLAQSDLDVAKAAGVPGAIPPDPPRPNRD